MAKPRDRLTKAPITEALVDLQVGLANPIESISIKELAKRLHDEYDQQGPIYQVQTKWSVAPNETPRTKIEARELGLRLNSKDGKFVLQARTGGFTLSRLEPYDNWHSLVAEARRLWGCYIAAIPVETVLRIAVRYINNLRLPMRHGEGFETYLEKPPDVPHSLPQGLLGFMQRIVLFYPDRDVRANVIQLLQEGPAPADHVPVILDIDVYKQVAIPPHGEALWAELPELRQVKNEIFFASLTEKAMELFE